MADEPKDNAVMDLEYKTFTMRDFHGRPSDDPILLTQIDYLTEMFDLDVQNEKGDPVVITLREKPEHFSARQEK